MISEHGLSVSWREGNSRSPLFSSLKALSVVLENTEPIAKWSRRRKFAQRLNKLEMCLLTHDHCFLEPTAHFVTRLIIAI